MLAYDSPSVLPWLQGMQQFNDAAYLGAHTAGLGQAFALAALSPQSLGPMDALQSMLLQGGQGVQSTDHSVSPTTPTDLTQLLAQLPPPPGLDPLSSLAPAASSPQQLLHADASSSSPPHYNTAAQSWAFAADHSNNSSPTPGLLQDQQPSNGPRVFVPESLKAAAASTAPNPQALLQTALGQQQPGMMGADDAANLLPLLPEQLLMQSLQQQAAAQPNIQAALAAALSSGTAGPQGLGQQPLAAALANSTAGNLWPFASPMMADPAAAATAAATAAALLAAQQQQQQAAVTRALASTGLLGGLDTNALLQLLVSQQGLPAGSPAAGSAAASVINQLQPWAIKALTAQMQQQGAASSLAAFNQQQLAIASLLNSATATAGSLPKPAPTPQGRRSRTGRRSSGTAAVAPDLANSFASRAGGDAGEAKALPAVLPAGVTAQDLCASKYEDTWGGDDATSTTTANAVNTAAVAFSTGSSCGLARGTSSASSSSIDSVTEGPGSLCGSAVSLSSTSRTVSGGSTEDKWQWDSHFCSLDEDVAAKGASGVSGRACRKGATAQRAQANQDSDATPLKDQDKDNKATAAAAALGCPVWIPGARESAGDDSWYLPRPVTCRLFVGNIGCWVDEAMLLAYFGKYGHVVDVQVMWNTKMLARGRRVNREFAFISYSNPLEAARAVHWLDGCRLPDMEKDKNGVTVEYENGEGDGPTAK